MAGRFLSDHYTLDSPTTTGETMAPPTIRYQPPGAIAGSAIRYKRARIALGGETIGAADEVRLATFRSNDRPIAIYITTNNGFSSNSHCGLYYKGFAHDGALIDVDLFGATVLTSGQLTRTELFEFSSTVDSEDRGKPFWQLAGLPEDPLRQMDLALTMVGSGSGGIANVETYFTRSDS